jgi:uncharacterized damage-inducible protein DinB
MNPYAKDLGDRNFADALRTTPGRIRELLTHMSPDAFGRSYAPGKWTARQLILHLAQTELAFSTRLRMALTTDNYVVQPFDQDRWMLLDADADAATSLAAYEGLRALNLSLIARLTKADLERPFTHPERGPMVAGEIPALMAGHELHHVPHFEAIAAQD